MSISILLNVLVGVPRMRYTHFIVEETTSTYLQPVISFTKIGAVHHLMNRPYRLIDKQSYNFYSVSLAASRRAKSHG